MADKEDVSAAPASDAPDAGGAAAPAERAPLEDRPQIEVVELDALVLLKLVRHCKESLPTFVTGQLLGLDIGRTLEVTSCFPFPSRDDADLAPEDDKDGAEYQVEMMRCLRNVNVDNNTVGWYQSTHLGSHMTESCLEHQFHYQEHIRNCVVLVFDPMQTTVGHLHLRAFRLTDAFMALYREKKFTPDALAAAKVSSMDVFQELPVKLHNSPLAMALLLELEGDEAALVDAQAAAYDLTAGPSVEKHCELLADACEDLANETYRLQFHERTAARQRLHVQGQLQTLLAQRKPDGSRRTQAEAEAELAASGALKPVPAPSRLEALLTANQIAHYCDQANRFASQSLGKLYLIDKVAERPAEAEERA